MVYSARLNARLDAERSFVRQKLLLSKTVDSPLASYYASSFRSLMDPLIRTKLLCYKQAASVCRRSPGLIQWQPESNLFFAWSRDGRVAMSRGFILATQFCSQT